jgi:hypothetical protein
VHRLSARSGAWPCSAPGLGPLFAGPSLGVANRVDRWVIAPLGCCRRNERVALFKSLMSAHMGSDILRARQVFFYSLNVGVDTDLLADLRASGFLRRRSPLPITRVALAPLECDEFLVTYRERRIRGLLNGLRARATLLVARRAVFFFARTSRFGLAIVGLGGRRREPSRLTSRSSAAIVSSYFTARA